MSSFSMALKEHRELSLSDKNMDPRKRERTIPMQVLSLGMPRTGTACE